MILSVAQLNAQPYLAGVDEVGRGPLVGDVVTAAVILDPHRPIAGLADSKRLSATQRQRLANEIITHALAYAIGRASPTEIDQLNILQATLLAMQRAVAALPYQPEFIAVDGNRCPAFSIPCQAVVKGDAHIQAISAASILAKVTRDEDMQQLHARHPEYGFAQHKGYPTAKHLAALAHLPILPEYRRSFKPVAQRLSDLSAHTY